MIPKHFDVIVIGAGLMGSAAARHLAEMGMQVAIIGLDEPAPGADAAVYASHYDEGRLTGRLSKSVLWSRLAQRAIRHYRMLEEASEIEFYRPVGLLQAEPENGVSWNESTAKAIAASEDLPYVFFPPGDVSWREHAPKLDFPSNFRVLFEPAPAGMINPRAMLAAQLYLAEGQRATLVRGRVVQVKEESQSVQVETETGTRYAASKALIAAGAFTNLAPLLPRPLPLRLKTETTLLGEVSAATAAELSQLPVVTYQIEDEKIDDIYMTPPVRYPDGRFYVKLGCNTRTDEWPTTQAEVQAWFHYGNSDACKPAMARAMRSLLPAVHFSNMRSARCIVCYTPSGLPTIDALSSRCFVAAGGNGSSAKCADTLGWLAAGLLADGRWPAEIERVPFTAR
jgi:sarcosine oxidase